MHRRLLLAAALAAVASLPLAVPAQAAGGWLTTRADETDNAALKVAARATIAPDGLSVTWPLRFTCPAGKTYSFTLATIEMDPPLVPELRGEDVGIAAWARPPPRRRPPAAGPCDDAGGPHRLGRRRHRRVDDAAAAHLGDGLRGTEALLTGDGFYAVWCYAPACADTSGTRAVELR